MVLDKVIEILKEYKDVEDGSIKESSTFHDLGFDSLDTVEIIMKLEDEFGVTIEMNENLKTVGDVVKYIEEKKA